MTQVIEKIVDLESHPLKEMPFRNACKRILDDKGVLVLKNFLYDSVIADICAEGEQQKHLAYYTERKHNIYLAPSDEKFPEDHPRNRLITSSKGCITSDQIPENSALNTLYNSSEFKQFLCAVLSEKELHAYADPLSSINLHYASKGQELGWHFDNSSFAITLLLQKPQAGSVFQFVKNVRNADAGETQYSDVEKILNNDVAVDSLRMNPGDLVLFRGRNSMHRVTPAMGDITRMLVVLAYNSKPGIALSESARLTFYGRV